MWNIFSCTCWPSVLFAEMLMFRSPAQFFIGFLCFDDIKPHELFVHFGNYSLLVTSFVNIFSQSVGCFFILFIVSFAVQKLSSLIRLHLFLFLFPLFWEMGWKRYYCVLCQRVFYLCFPLGVFNSIQSRMMEEKVATHSSILAWKTR